MHRQILTIFKDKKMKIITINSKGGVGKSTTSMQVIAPFLYEIIGNKKVKFVELDDENQDSTTFARSELVDAQQIQITGTDLDSKLLDIIVDNDNIIIDVGGNKTTTFVIDSLSNTGIINALDLIVIPLGDGEQDASNAIKLYNRVRDLNSDIKIVFALSRVDSSMDLEMQFFDFFGDKQGRVDDRVGLIDKIAATDQNIIKIRNSEVIKYSRAFGITAYELSDKNVDDVKEKMKQALVKKDNAKVKKLAYRQTILNKAADYRKTVLDPAFEVLKTLV